MPTLSVIIPVYNAENTLNECIDSILIQEFHDFEILLIDDGSKDNSRAICNDYAIKDSRVKILYKENGGVSSARNMGLNHAQGKWITFIDADDYIEPEYFHDINDEAFDLIIKSYKELRNSLITTPTANIHSDVSLTASTDVSDFISRHLATMVLRGPCGKFYKRELIGCTRFNGNMKVGEDSCFVFNYLTTVKKIKLQAGASYIVRCANVSAANKYGCSVEYAIQSLQFLYDAHLALQEAHAISSESFLSYIGYFKLISKSDWKKDLKKWYADNTLKKMYQYIWPYLPIKQKIEYYGLSKILPLLK